DAALAAIHGIEVMRHIGVADLRSANQAGQHVTADVAAFAIFDLGDFSTEVSQKKCRERSLDFLRDLDNLDSFNRLRHLDPLDEDYFQAASIQAFWRMREGKCQGNL